MADHATHDGKAAGGSPPAVELIDLNKFFGPVHANRDVCMAVAPGTIHGIVGENGAGKSTMMGMLYGFYQASSGRIRIHGREVKITSPSHAIRQGIGMVHQHFMLVEPFTVLENVILGAEEGKLIKTSLAHARTELERLAREYGLEVDLDARVGDLSVGLQQRVEILKALYRGAEILILDEPTGVLTPQEADQLFRMLDTLRSQGRTVILITHKLREIMAITDTVSIMRRGTMVAHRRTAETSKEELAELMVGRKVLLQVDKGEAAPGERILDVNGVSYSDQTGALRLNDISFSLRRGEILGIAGVSGNGQSELLEVLSGVSRVSGGTISYLGSVIAGPGKHTNPLGMHELGVGHVAEDRHHTGMVMDFTAAENIILGYHNGPDINGPVLMDLKKVDALCAEYMDKFDVRPRNPRQAATGFSGGNQQKIVLAREIERDPELLLVGQPTRGVDIGAIEFIHKRIIELRDQGKGVLLVSVELDEILSLADRILVLFEGCIVGELTAEEADECTLGLMMAGIDPASEAAQPKGEVA
ncbi:ABC transporter ATP-binding protein [Pseudodesulfovibrio sediminis]|uniref:Sugar ABC transporter ATP-binding protein n=1 Tax=Pseudodesulfovibrio sediminis TaxID=2810563 RepID=A0ABM7P829_9BACT|nr:ABC transporter ATP-binding protein [Pseudodesulfovibrio sediminis]BCS89142.1 sugar ABC transporter ATP-binding protein [Pseudodesulfovibrio sediminis]